MNRTLLLRLAFLAAAVMGGAFSLAGQSAGQMLYGITFVNNQVISINTNTGQGTLVGNLNTNLSPYGIAARYGRLFAFSPVTDQIVSIDPGSGQILDYYNIGVTNIIGQGNLAFRNDGVGFLASALHPDGSLANDLYTFDVIARSSQRIGTTSLTLDALAFDANNNLYALAKNDDTLYLVNQSNAGLTPVGPLGVLVNSPFAALTFGPDGRLYAALNDQLYVVNPNNGSAALAGGTNAVLDIGFNSVSGLAFQMPNPSARLVGVTAIGNQLFSLNGTNGAGTFVGSFGTNVSAYGIATRSNILYTFDPNNDKVVVINPTSRLLGTSINIGVTNLVGEGDLAFNNAGLGYLASALHPDATLDNGLYTFDLNAGTSRRIGTSSEAIDALAFDTNGVLFALGQDDSMLYTVNTNTASLTAVGPLGVAMASPYAGMTFGPDGTLYAAINDVLYTINPHTGAASLVSTNVVDIGFSSVSGLAFAPAPPQLFITMEGGTAVLYFLGKGYTLQSSPNMNGPFTNTRFQTQITRIPPNISQMFFRLVR